MARKRHTAEEIVAKLRRGDVLTAQGRQVADAARFHAKVLTAIKAGDEAGARGGISADIYSAVSGIAVRRDVSE